MYNTNKVITGFSASLEYLDAKNQNVKLSLLGMVAHTCNHSIQEAEVGGLCEFKASMALHSELQANLDYNMFFFFF